MGDIKGFLEVKRKNTACRKISERVKDFYEVALKRSLSDSTEQASRCMDCGTPFCHWGCPAGNYIPEWNNFLCEGNYKKAFELLDAANNFPEVTGRLCPAICEYSCVLGINPVRSGAPRRGTSNWVNDDAVTIKENELAIIECAFENEFIKARLPKKRTGEKIAVIGSGPAGLSCAAQLNKAGHKVVVFEKDDKIGGLLRYGIPDFKLEKWIIDRRVKLWKKEGVKFETSINAGIDYPAAKLKKDFDAVCLAGGSRVSRDLKVEGRELKGVYFALDYLVQSNKRVAGIEMPGGELIDAGDKKVVVIGGGDTGADCVGTAHRQGAGTVVQIEILPKPAEYRAPNYPWPTYPVLLKKSSSHEEGGERLWSVLTKKFIGDASGRVKKIVCAKVEFSKDPKTNSPVMEEIPGSEFEIAADMVVLAMGFVQPEHSKLLKDLKVEFDARGNVKTDADYKAAPKKIFSCGDMRRGQSLIVWAMFEGRQAARKIDEQLMGKSSLPWV